MARRASRASLFNKKKTALEQVRDKNERLETLIAIHEYDLEEKGIDTTAYTQEAWVSTRARKKRERAQKKRDAEAARDAILEANYRATREEMKNFGMSVTPSPTQSEEEARARREAEDRQRRFESYQNRVRRNGEHLLLLAAVGQQYRETNLAQRDGRIVRGAGTGKPRKYVAFDKRRTSSLSTTEAQARAWKNKVNRSRAKSIARRRRSRSPSCSSDPFASSASFSSSSSGGDGGGWGGGGGDESGSGSEDNSGSGSEDGMGADVESTAKFTNSNSGTEWDTDSEIDRFTGTASLSEFSGLESQPPTESDDEPASSSEKSADLNAEPSPESDSESSEYREGIMMVAHALIAQAEADPGPGEWFDKLSKPLVDKYSDVLPEIIGVKATASLGVPISKKKTSLYSDAPGLSPPSSRQPNRPPTPDKDLYDPTMWERPITSQDDSVSWWREWQQTLHKTQGIQVESGYMTWREADKSFPPLGQALHLHDVRDKVWNPQLELIRQNKLDEGGRTSLTLDVITKLSLQNREISESAGDYSLAVADPPEMLSHEDKKRSGPPNHKLPLVGPSGRSARPGREQAKFNLGVPPKKEAPKSGTTSTESPLETFSFPARSPVTSAFQDVDQPGTAYSFGSVPNPPTPFSNASVFPQDTSSAPEPTVQAPTLSSPPAGTKGKAPKHVSFEPPPTQTGPAPPPTPMAPPPPPSTPATVSTSQPNEAPAPAPDTSWLDEFKTPETTPETPAPKTPAPKTSLSRSPPATTPVAHPPTTYTTTPTPVSPTVSQTPKPPPAPESSAPINPAPAQPPTQPMAPASAPSPKPTPAPEDLPNPGSSDLMLSLVKHFIAASNNKDPASGTGELQPESVADPESEAEAMPEPTPEPTPEPQTQSPAPITTTAPSTKPSDQPGTTAPGSPFLDIFRQPGQEAKSAPFFTFPPGWKGADATAPSSSGTATGVDKAGGGGSLWDAATPEQPRDKAPFAEGGTAGFWGIRQAPKPGRGREALSPGAGAGASAASRPATEAASTGDITQPGSSLYKIQHRGVGLAGESNAEEEEQDDGVDLGLDAGFGSEDPMADALPETSTRKARKGKKKTKKRRSEGGGRSSAAAPPPTKRAKAVHFEGRSTPEAVAAAEEQEQEQEGFVEAIEGSGELQLKHPRLVMDYAEAVAWVNRVHGAQKAAGVYPQPGSDEYVAAHGWLDQVKVEVKRVMKEEVAREHAEALAEGGGESDEGKGKGIKEGRQPHGPGRLALSGGPNETMREEARRAVHRLGRRSSRGFR